MISSFFGQFDENFEHSLIFKSHFFGNYVFKVSNFFTPQSAPLGNGTNVMSNAFWGKYQKITSRFLALFAKKNSFGTSLAPK